MEFVSETSSSVSIGTLLTRIGLGSTSFCSLREAGVVVVVVVPICCNRISGDGEIKAGFGRRDLDSIFKFLLRLGVESERTDRLVDIL